MCLIAVLMVSIRAADHGGLILLVAPQAVELTTPLTRLLTSMVMP